MRALTRIVVMTAVVSALIGPTVAARAETCDKTHDRVRYLYCQVVGGCIASGPVAVDPVVCD